MTRALVTFLSVGCLLLTVACTGSVISGENASDVATPDVKDDSNDGGPVDAVDAGDTDSNGDLGNDSDSVTPDGDATDTPDIPVVEPDWALAGLGDRGTLDNVFAVSPNEAYAAGGTRILRYNGRTWASYGDPAGKESGTNMHAVWSDGDVVIGVGDGGTIVRRVAGALGWTTDTVPADTSLYGVFGRAADDIWAVGDKTTILHWDGTAWTEMHSGDGLTLHAVWAPEGTAGPDDVIAVGTKGRLMRWNADDAVFKPQQIAAGSVDLYGVVGQGDMRFAVGTGATITMRTSAAGTWQGQSSNDTQSRDLYGIVAATPTSVVAVGESGAIIRFDGDKWNVEPAQAPTYGTANFRGIAYAGAGTSAWLVIGAEGGGVRFDGDADAWVDMQTRPDAELRHIDGTDALWAAGRSGLLMTEHPVAGWSAVPTASALDFNDVAVASDGTVWVVGDQGTVLERGSDGVITNHELAIPVSLFGVAVSDSQVVVAGKGGTLLGGDPTADTITFTPLVSGTQSDLKAATFGGDGALWLAGAFGTLMRSDGALPLPVTTGIGGSLNTIAATEDGVLVAGDNGVILRATAAGADLLYESPGLFIYGLSYANAVGFATGWNGGILRIDGTVVTPEVGGTNAVIEAVWHDGTRAIATGRQGVLLTRLEAP